jgi:hypothetical protein
MLPGRPPGFAKSRETFPNSTGSTFDPLGPAQSAIALTLDVLLDPARATRMIVGNARSSDVPGFHEICSSMMDRSWYATRQPGIEGAIQRSLDTLVLERLLLLSVNPAAHADVRALALDSVHALDGWLSARAPREADSVWRAHYLLARQSIRRAQDDPASLEKLLPLPVPPGSPIGSTLGLASGDADSPGDH